MAAVTEEDSMADTPVVVIEVGTLEDSTVGIMVVDTMVVA